MGRISWADDELLLASPRRTHQGHASAMAFDPNEILASHEVGEHVEVLAAHLPH